MIISHKYKFIFIKTGKTAGTSIEVFLSGVCGQDDIVTPIIPYVEPHSARNYEEHEFYNHIPALDIKKRISSEIWDNYFKFCVERNPWDKTLSHYHMVNYRSGGNLSLEEYLEKRSFCLNYPKYTNQKGENIIVDQIVMYEQLEAGLMSIFCKLGIAFNGDLGVRAKSEYRKNRRHYRNVLTEHQAGTIAKAFSKELAMHGYKY